jgi:hypothetical protein
VKILVIQLDDSLSSTADAIIRRLRGLELEPGAALGRNEPEGASRDKQAKDGGAHTGAAPRQAQKSRQST